MISHTLINIITDISIFQSEKGDLLGTEDLLGLSAAGPEPSISALLCVLVAQSCLTLQPHEP